MMRYLLALLFLILSFDLLGIDYVPNQLIFKTTVPIELNSAKTGLDNFDGFLSDQNVKVVKPVLKKTQNSYFVATFYQDIDWDQIKHYRFNGIEYLQPNYISKLHLMPNDELLSEQLLHLENCYIPDAWNLSTGSEEIIVAVIDSGIHFDHPDLQSNIYINSAEILDDGIDNDGNGYIDDWRGWDFVHAPELSSIAIGDYLDQDNDPTDELDHGTHIAGIIGADTNNTIGISGICWNIKMMILRCGFATSLPGVGYLTDDNAAEGIVYAADMGANVINLSWGDTNYSQIIADACNYAYQKGSIIVASAGNEGANPDHQITYPARLSTTLAVGAVTQTNILASFSSWGEQIDLVAPGNIILSTNSTEELYNEMSGTSVSAPFVTASIALLLSNEPELTFEQVRGRLISSATDLGEKGFDYLFGYGLLNTYNLLIGQNYPQIVITSPYDYQGISSSFDIIGTVNAPNFWRYSLKYTDKILPEPADWINIDPDIQYYNLPVVNGVIGHFEVYDFFPDNFYKIKIDLRTTHNESFSYLRTVYIDQTPPFFYNEYAASMQRYNGDVSEYYLQAVFDEDVFIDSDVSPDFPYYPSVKADSLQVIKIATDICGAGMQSIDLKATNISGLETLIYDAYQIDIQLSSVPEHGMVSEIIGNEIVSVRKTYDFDDNGINEFINLNTVNGVQSIQIMEPAAAGMVIKHIFSEMFWPHDMGISNEEGNIEILGLSADRAVLIETDNGSSYPDQTSLVSDNTYGANFADYDGDGIDEIILVKNVTQNQITYRALVLLNRIGDLFDEEHVILNTTPTSQWNTFTNRVLCGYLDNDAMPDILAADTDGDLMIYEKNGEDFVQTWTRRLPVPNVYYLAIGDFTGDGSNEFCAGGYTINYTDPNKTFSYFAFFKNTGEDNQYEQIGYVSFSQVDSRNSISAIDLNSDGKQNLFLSVPPNAYMIEYQNGEFIPIWKGNSASTSQNTIAASSKTSTDDAYLIFNLKNGDDLQGSILRPEAEFYGPPTPQYFTVYPLNEHSAVLDWHSPERALFNVYRKKNDLVEKIADNINESYFLDEELSLNDTVFYRVTAVDTLFNPPESQPTSWRQVITDYPPQVSDIKMISAHQVEINFDRQLISSAANRSHYWLEPGYGLPNSVSIIHNYRTIILSFLQHLEPVDEYNLYFSENLPVTGLTGVPADSGPYAFYYEPDTTSPSVLHATCESDRIVHVIFSEPLDQETAENIQNYTLLLPAADPNNSIKELSYVNADSSYTTITFQKSLVYTNQNYFLQVDNVEDLAGNMISSSSNKCHFNLTGYSGPKNLSQLVVYPNPLNISESGMEAIRFINLPLNKQGELSIFDLSGEKIFDKKIGPFLSSVEHVNWDCRNNSGNKVSSGMYYYIISLGSDLKRGKIVIIN